MGDLLKGKVAVVTGAGKGIGAAIAKRMGSEGADVVIIDINRELGNKVADEIRAMGVRSEAMELDITNIPSIKPLFNKIAEKFGTIDILVNNAGICKVISIEDLSERDWDFMLNLNLKSYFFCSQAVFDIMKKQNYGKIINMSSMAGERGGRFTGANYSASKAGLLGLTKSFALNGGPYNITANAICPGLIDTDMAVELAFPKNPPEVPLNRLGTADEVAKGAVFLASELASFVSGHTLDINGGQYMR